MDEPLRVAAIALKPTMSRYAMEQVSYEEILPLVVPE